jgi:AcrR family transcriptional regulator
MKKLSRKEQIIKTAQNMFREKGYAGTSMRDLANAVGIEAASLYNHIKSKEDLLLRICLEVSQDFFDALDEIKDVEMPAEEKLTLVIEKHVTIVTQNLDGAAVFLHEWRFLQKDNFNRLKNIRKRYRAEFQKIVQAGVEEGVFKNINPISRKSKLIITLHRACLVYSINSNGLIICVIKHKICPSRV